MLVNIYNLKYNILNTFIFFLNYTQKATSEKVKLLPVLKVEITLRTLDSLFTWIQEKLVASTYTSSG